MNKIIVIANRDLNLPSLENAETVYCKTFTDALKIGGDYVLFAGDHFDIPSDEINNIWENHKDEVVFFSHKSDGFLSSVLSFVLTQVNAYSFKMIFEDNVPPAFFMPFETFEEYGNLIPDDFIHPSSAFLAGSCSAKKDVVWKTAKNIEKKESKSLTALLEHPFKALATYRKVDENLVETYGKYEMKQEQKSNLSMLEKLQLFASREIITYVIFGVLTTLVNLVSFILIDEALGAERFIGEKNYLIAQGIAWVISLVFAYITNKIWVFSSKSWEPKLVLYEVATFTGARVFSFVVETIGLAFLVSGLHVGKVISKIVMGIVTVILNYFFSKLIIFRDKDKTK